MKKIKNKAKTQGKKKVTTMEEAPFFKKKMAKVNRMIAIAGLPE